MSMTTYDFGLPLMQAVSDWQRGTPDEKQRYRRAQRLREECVNLPQEFKECHLTCLRQIALDKRPIWDLLGKQSLAGRVSSWTADMDVAKTFLGGIPPVDDGLTHIILARFPRSDQVIVNLRSLLAHPDYQAATKRHESQIQLHAAGTGKHGNSQAEVILDVEAHSENDIWAFGGWSSSFADLERQAFTMMYGRLPNSAEFEEFHATMKVMEGEAGARWLQQESTQRVLDRVRPRAEALAQLERDREARRMVADQEIGDE